MRQQQPGHCQHSRVWFTFHKREAAVNTASNHAPGLFMLLGPLSYYSGVACDTAPSATHEPTCPTFRSCVALLQHQQQRCFHGAAGVVVVIAAARYPVRMVLVDLQQPPPWFQQQQASDHLSLQAARDFAMTDGETRLSRQTTRLQWR